MLPGCHVVSSPDGAISLGACEECSGEHEWALVCLVTLCQPLGSGRVLKIQIMNGRNVVIRTVGLDESITSAYQKQKRSLTNMVP